MATTTTPLSFVVFRNLLDPHFVKLRRRAVIADERNHQHLAGGIFFKTMRLAIDPGQTEVRSRGTGGQDWMFASIGGGGAQNNRREKAQEQKKEGNLKSRHGCTRLAPQERTHPHQGASFACVFHNQPPSVPLDQR
jgi:hypothetical protein